MTLTLKESFMYFSSIAIAFGLSIAVFLIYNNNLFEPTIVLSGVGIFCSICAINIYKQMKGDKK